MDLSLTLACGDYDLTKPLEDGEVEPKGVDLNVQTYPSPERHWRMLENHEFDVCEMSLGSYLLSQEMEEECPFTAIPVFPHRRFRHSYMFASPDSGITDPGAFDGKKVGIKNWQNSAGIWMRGIANEHYGLPLENVEWYSSQTEDLPITIPDRFDVTVISDSDVETMVETGELDGAFYPLMLDLDRVDRVFDDSIEVEASYYQETGIFPLMHTVVIHDDVLESDPWVAINLFEAFSRSRDVCLKKLEDPRWTALAWARQHLEHQQEVLGPNPWPFGLTEENAHALDTLLGYAHDQGLISEVYDHDQLFVEWTLDTEDLQNRVNMGAKILE